MGRMDATDAERLRHRRALLQLRHARQQQAATARDLGARLNALGVGRLSRLPPLRCQQLMAPFAQWPGQDEHFSWDGVAGAHCAWWTTPEERDAAFRRALSEAMPDPATRIALIFHTAESALVLSAGEANRHARPVLDALFGTLWVRPLRGHDDALVELVFPDSAVCWRAARA